MVSGPQVVQDAVDVLLIVSIPHKQVDADDGKWDFAGEGAAMRLD